MAHVPGREELPLLDVDRLAGRGRGEQKVGLAAEKGRDLQNVHGLGDRGTLLFLVHVGDHRQADPVSDLGEDGKGLVKPNASCAGGAGAVRLVEGGFVNEPDPQPARDLLQRLRRFERMGAALEHARPGDQRKRRGLRKAHAAHGNALVRLQGLMLVHGAL